MADHPPTQPELFDVTKLPGRPMLHWHGKQLLREIPYYPAQLRERYGEFPADVEPAGAWANRLYWGDNLQVMAHLTVEQFYFPLLLQKLSLEDDPEAIEDWRQTVASVLIDPSYDGEVFHARITDAPARRDELVHGEYTWQVGEYGEGQVAVKIVDVLDEEWFGAIRVEGSDAAALASCNLPAPLGTINLMPLIRLKRGKTDESDCTTLGRKGTGTRAPRYRAC